MTDKKWLAPILPYLAVAAGLFLLKSAWLALILFHLVIFLALFLARPNVPINILFKHKNQKWTLLSVFLCGASGIVLYFLWDVFGIANNLLSQIEALGLNKAAWILFIAYFTFINPLIEEYFWRGYLGSDAKGFYIGDLIYAGYHAMILLNKVAPASILFALACLTFIGWLWRQLKRMDGGLLAPVLGHMVADFSILTVVYLMTT